MPTQTPLTDAINALTTYANTVTGASDTTLSDAVATLAAGYGGGGSSNEDAILNRSITTLTNNNITVLGASALANCTALTSLTLGSVTTLKQGAMNGCTGITSLSDANFPSLTAIEGEVFWNMTNLQTVNLTGNIDLKNYTYTFRACTNMTSCLLPNALTSQNSGSTQRTFYGCTKLAVCDLGKVTGVGVATFQGCTALRTLILRKTDTVATLNGWNNGVMGGIYDNPSASTIYVPNALISSYQTASNWASAYAAGVTFTKIEGSIYE